MSKHTEYFVAMQNTKRRRTSTGVDWTVLTRGYLKKSEAKRQLKAYETINYIPEHEYFIVAREIQDTI